MEPFIERLREILQSQFADSRNTLEVYSPARVGGFLIWDGFVGLDELERQHQVWDFLKTRLNQDERRKIAAILTVTPREWAAMEKQ